jgi:uncharacterized protein YbaR (Trm112 family)
MYLSLLPLLRSPDNAEPLVLSITRQDGDDIVTGTLTGSDGRIYPIEDGIPRLLPSDLLDAQKSEIAARDAQAADYDRMAFLNSQTGRSFAGSRMRNRANDTRAGGSRA